MSNNKVIFMTGATSGLGKISALKAAGNGAIVIALARSKEKGETLRDDFKKQYPESSGRIDLIEGDLNSLKSLSHACTIVSENYPVIDIIVNNAGIMNFEPKLTSDHIEETLQVNLLSPLLICHLLYDNLKQSIDPKIIITSSGLHQGKINFDNLEFTDNFSSFKVYRQSKLGVILICRLLAKPLKEDNIGIYCQHPGMVRTNLGRSAGWFSKLIFYIMGKSPEKGSKTLSYLIENGNTNLISGEYYANNKVTKTTKESYDLNEASKLLSVIQKYLSEHIDKSTTIFNKE